jgi:hypothetical protein
MAIAGRLSHAALAMAIVLSGAGTPRQRWPSPSLRDCPSATLRGNTDANEIVNSVFANLIPENERARRFMDQGGAK